MIVPLSSAASALGRFFAWSFLPSTLARVLLKFYHNFLHPNSAPPHPSSPVYISQYRIAFTILAVLYLIYTLVAASTSLEPNFYEILGTERSVDERGLKLAYRAFVRYNHPDRVGADGEQRFRDVRDAYEMLKHPVKRFAYERFGPEILTWAGCNTPREYIRQGIMSSCGFFIGSGIFLLGMTVLGRANSSAFVSSK